jgi:hypothetical protein
MKRSEFTAQQETEAQALSAKILEGMQDEVLDMARDMVATPDHELLGPGEFAVRDHVHRMGAKAIETTVNDRKKGV